MKYLLLFFSTKPIFSIFFFFSLITLKIHCEETLEEKVKDVCSKAESSIKSYFEEKKELPEKFQNFKVENNYTESELTSAVKFLLIDQEAINNFMKTKNNEKKYNKIIIKILIIISVIFILNFEIHFFLRICFKKDISEPSFINFYKISPFYWILYFVLNKQKQNTLYKKILNNHTSRKKKYLIFTFGFIIFIIIAAIFVMTYFVAGEYDNSSVATINVLCTSIKFLNEIQNGKKLSKDGLRLIGLKDINLFLNELMENGNVFNDYFKNYSKTYNEVNNDLNKWDNYLVNIQKNLSDKNSSKYFFYNYPSNPKYIDQISCNFSNPEFCKKSLFQTKFIYDYYPYNDSSKILYLYNNKLNENIHILLGKLEIFEKCFMNSGHSLNLIFESQNHKNGLFKIESIINIYINHLLEIDKKEIFDKLIFSYLSFIYSFDFALLIFFGLNSLLAILYVEYYCVKKHYFGRLVISFVFYNIVFMILGLSFIEIYKLKRINIAISYIKEISKGIYYILNDEIKNYENLFNEENNSYIKNISLFMQFKNNKTSNNLFYYIKYYINNENELKNLLNDKILKTSQLYIINNTLNEFIDIKNNSIDSQINDYSEIILKLINEGLKHSTNFVDLTIDNYLESPFSYLTYVNLITKKTTREKFIYKELIPCDEIWNISTVDENLGNYKYKSKNLILCENCNNTCSSDKILLNFMEYTIDEIEQRYSFLKNEDYIDAYYELMYYFNATEKLRNKKIFEQLDDLYKMNENLKNIQKNIFSSIKKMGYIAKKIIATYENIVNKYEKENIFLNYTEFIKDDLYYLLGQIEINFLQKINIQYKTHLNINIMCFCICFSLIIFYTLVSKEMKYYKTDNDNSSHNKSDIDDISSIEENVPNPANSNSFKNIQVNVKNENKTLTNVMNIFVINENKFLKKYKTMTVKNNIFDNDVNKNINNIENNDKKNAQLLNNKKNLIISEFIKNSPQPELDESKNDESGLGLAKVLMIGNRKRKIIDTINKETNKYLNYANIKSFDNNNK